MLSVIKNSHSNSNILTQAPISAEQGKQKPEVLSQPYWCWSLICMCYQPISLGTHTLTQRHTHTHTHTPHARTHKARSHVHTGSRIVHKHRHTHSHKDCVFTLNTDAYSPPTFRIFPLTFIRAPFLLSSLPYAPDALQMCRYYRKSLHSRVFGEKRGENY